MSDGVLSGPIDLERRRPRRPTVPEVPVERGLEVGHRASGFTGRIIRYGQGLVALERPDGSVRNFSLEPAAFSIQGRPVTLVRPRPPVRPPSTTASGSLAPEDLGARVARASRICVEGIHDAELIERVWGDDLRAEGVVVSVLDGADELAELVRVFDPGPRRRLGILLDHLVPGSKEQRLAESIDHPWVTITGHPFVDVWQCVRPRALGIEAWPVIPRGRPWKEGVCAELGWRGTPASFWREVLGRVGSYADLEPSFVGAVEQLIDFVAPPPED